MQSHQSKLGQQRRIRLARVRPQVGRKFVQPCAALSSQRSARKENVDGDVFVDHTCIDCDTCRWMQPEVFTRVNGQSAVVSQPNSDAQRIRSLQALLSCPTYSIHIKHTVGDELKRAQQGLPALVPGCKDVYHCGWHSAKSYASASWLIVRPEGNVLVDSPRFNPVLLRRLKELGGVKYMFLTHKDDVADHAEWSKALGCQRIIHEKEIRRGGSLADVEIKLQGQGPWGLPGQPADGDVQLLHTPGHTAGHVTLYYRPDKAIFTGDHVAGGEEVPDHLTIFTDYVQHSFKEQLQSVRKLMDYEILHLLPGHGRPYRFRDALHQLQEFDRLLRSFKAPGVASKEVAMA